MNDTNNIETNKQLITSFYQAFANKDAAGMTQCYAENAVFEDPGFGRLNSEEVKAMWEMLVARGGKELKVTHSHVTATNGSASARWEAIYVFKETSRPVHNKIKAEFLIENGKIVFHKDRFNLWKWFSMALGLPGMLFGWTPFFKKKLHQKTRKALNQYLAKKK